MSDPSSRPPRIVAELGRPETPEETAARKAESSRKRRSNQTLVNLVLAVVASLGIVLFLVIVVVRPTQPAQTTVDYRADAAASQSQVDTPLAAPDLPKTWTANSDSLNTGSDGVVSWRVGLITPSVQYIGITQGIDANPTWLSNELQKATSTGSKDISGTTWTVYDQRAADDPGNYAYSLVATFGESTIVLHGTASNAEFRTLAAKVAEQLTRGETR